MIGSGFGHDEHGDIVPTEQFNYDALDGYFGPDEEDLSDLTPEDVERALKLFRKLLRWVFQNGMKNAEGVKIRSIIMCWIFLEELRPLTLTDLAAGYGMDKQSFGRWVDIFKKDFHNIRNAHQR
jgi:hypothetical protein